MTKGLRKFSQTVIARQKPLERFPNDMFKVVIVAKGIAAPTYECCCGHGFCLPLTRPAAIRELIQLSQNRSK
jgi:hypothetical protein